MYRRGKFYKNLGLVSQISFKNVRLDKEYVAISFG